VKVLAPLLAIALSACAQAAPIAAAKPDFPVKRCVQIAHALEAPNEGDWGFRIERADIDAIADAEFDTIRLPIQWSAHADAAPPYRIDPAFFARVDEVIGWAFARDLNVIFTVHNYDALWKSPNTEKARFLALWDQIGAHYKDYPPALIFTPFNEPAYELQGRAWADLIPELVARIRATNPTRVLIIGGDNWFKREAMLQLKLPPDPNIVATFHYYEPYEFAVQGAEWFANPPPVGRDWGNEAERATLARDFAEAADWAQQNNRIVFLGEFGAHVASPPQARLRWHEAVRKTAEANSMPWCVHDFSANFGVFDRATRVWKPGFEAALMGP
jgi:endoglucanase